jgi:hypothetical protein
MNNKSKDISYLGKDFDQFRKNLIQFTKQYFPEKYTDFNESSPGSIFIEMSAYVGDVLSYYADSNLRESFLNHASERGNVFDLARALGYNAKITTPSHVVLDVFQLVPASGSGTNVVPDFNYALNIKSGMRVKQSSGSTQFRTLNAVNFNQSSSYDPTDITIYDVDDSTNQPKYFLLKKRVKAVSGDVRTVTYTFGAAKPYDKIVLPDENIVEIISVKESDGDVWFEVPYLAQDTVFESIPNVPDNDPELSQYIDSVPSLLKLRKASKRFTKRVRSDLRVELQFGAGISTNNDEEIIPNPTNVGNGLQQLRQAVDIAIDPSNFLYTRAYGQAPANTTLTVTYAVGNGIQDNVESNTIDSISFVDFFENKNSTNLVSMVNFVKTTLAVINTEPATGGKGRDTLLEIKNNASAYFSTQQRNVTKEDYIIRSYSLPSEYGSVSKAYIVPDDQISQTELQTIRVQNPLALNLYVLGYNSQKQLIPLNSAIKENLKTYLGYYRMLTDAINIKDAFIINIGVYFEITVRSNFNSNEVLLRCINELKEHFNIDRWQINQPIIKSDILNLIANVQGVQSVVNAKITNRYKPEDGYSGNVYNISTAERNGVIFPSLDPSIFEVRYPNNDIVGRVVSL